MPRIMPEDPAEMARDILAQSTPGQFDAYPTLTVEVPVTLTLTAVIKTGEMDLDEIVAGIANDDGQLLRQAIRDQLRLHQTSIVAWTEDGERCAYLDRIIPELTHVRSIGDPQLAEPLADFGPATTPEDEVF